MRRTELPREAIARAHRTGTLLAGGVPRSRLRAIDAAHPFHGVVAFDAATTTLADRARLALPVLPRGAAFSHRTAALLHRGALPLGQDVPLDIAVVAPARAPRRRGIRGHQVVSMEIVDVEGLPVVAPAEAWLQLARILERRDLVALGDSLLAARRRRGAVSLAELAAATEAHRHAYGIDRARAALPHLRAGVDSRPESLLRLLIVDAGLPEPAVSPPVEVLPGLVLHPDLGYPRERIAIEYEGDHHRSDAAQWRHDIERRELFTDAGWRNVIVTPLTLFAHPRTLARRLLRLLANP